MTEATSRFDTGSDDYARFRPSYPDGLLQQLAAAIAAVPASGLPVLDVGAGTGIFSRQLATQLGPAIPIVAVEPAATMRAHAAASGLTVLDGTAEALPVPPRSARAITAATAAHWFDRPAFYAEARRILIPGGVLAIIEYVRDVDHSPAARAVATFLDRHGPRDYARPDYAAELQQLSGFHSPVERHEPVVLPLTIDQFVGLALSSSHARPAIAALGRDGAEAELQALARPLQDASGHVPYGYSFNLLLTHRSPTTG